MKAEYQNWINEHYRSRTQAYGACAEATTKMQEAFPELIRVRGQYLCWAWGLRDHWWLVTAEGDIIDPTAAQFPSLGKGDYIPRDESQKEPTGMCPNCGGECYDNDYCCSDECGRSYVAYCSQGF